MSLPIIPGSLPSEPSLGYPSVSIPQSYIDSSLNTSYNRLYGNNMSGLMSIGAAGVGAVGDIVSGLFSGHANRRENRRNRQFAHDEAVLAHQRQLEIMDKMNEYNTPLAQRKRMEEAGFSPWTMTAGDMAGSATSSGASGGAQASSPSSIPASFGDFGGLMNVLQAKMMESQINKTNAETNKLGYESEGQRIENTFNEIQTNLLKAYGKIEKEIGLKVQDSISAMNDAQRQLFVVNQKLGQYDLEHLRPAQVSNYVASSLLSGSQASLNKLLEAKTDAERKQILNSISVQNNMMWSSIALNNAQIRTYNEQARLFKEQSHYTSGLYGLAEQQFNIRKSLWNEKNGPLFIGARSNANTSYWNSVRYSSLYSSPAIIGAMKNALYQELRKSGNYNKNEADYYSNYYFYNLEKVSNIMAPFVPLGGMFNNPQSPAPVNGYNPYTTNFSYEGM